MNRETGAAQTNLKMEIGGGHAGHPKRRAKIISEVESWSEERRTHQAEKFDRMKVIKIDGGFTFHAILL